jgi:hypothetical protein
MTTPQVHEIILAPANGSTGANLICLLRSIDVSEMHIVAYDIDCNRNRSWVGRKPFCVTFQDVIDYAATVDQFDWASFFFYLDQPDDNNISQQSYDELFANADLVVRVVDDTYFYVYSSNAEDVLHLAHVFPVESSELKDRQEIVHPF